VVSFTVRNAVLVALAQAGVVVAGALGAGAAHKWYATFGLRPPATTAVVADLGFLALAVPVVWAALALRAVLAGDEEDGPKWLAFGSGAAVLFLLLLGAWHASAWPLLRLCRGCGGLSN
jgi:hypothetical protein